MASRAQGLASSILGCATRGSRWLYFGFTVQGLGNLGILRALLMFFNCSPTVDE